MLLELRHVVSHDRPQKMQSRTLLLEQFSSFLQLSGDRFQGWSSDPRLRKSMGSQLKQSPDERGEREQFWALYWHQCWQRQSHVWAEQHLLAYLQEPCYWVALEILRKVAGLRYQGAASESPVDFFQMAMAEVPLALGKFKPEKSSYLKSFAQVFLANRIKSRLRKQRQADFCSHWGLLRKTSLKQLLAVLQAQGLGKTHIAQYRLLWMGFQALYVPSQPNSGQLPEPDGDLWQDIAAFYNGQRLTFLEASAPHLPATAVEQQLQLLSQWIRNYHYPPVDSLNRPRFLGEDSGPAEDWQGAIASEDSESLLSTLIDQEELAQREQTQTQLHGQLAQAFTQLDGQSQLILHLLYRQGLSQEAITSQVQVSQPTVSRRVKTAKKHLLESLLRWVQRENQATTEAEVQKSTPKLIQTSAPTSAKAGSETNRAFQTTVSLNNFPNPDQLKAINVALEEWLRVYLRESAFLDEVGM